MKNSIFIIIFLIQCIKCFPQREGNIWCFGDSALIDWNDADNPTFGRSISKNRGSASSIADSLGNLLFYVGNVSGATSPEWEYCRDTLVYYERGYVYTKENTFMENGRCISGEGWYNEHTIIPVPGSDSLYYIFSVDLYDHPGVNYSIINMNANEGLGKVIERDFDVVSYTPGGLNPLSWCIKAIRHGNGRDWWIISKTTDNLEPNLYFILLLVTPNGVEVQQIPVIEPECGTGFSTCGFSKDGTKFYSMCPEYPFGNIVIYDFNRCTGELTNQKVIDETPEVPIDSINYYPFIFFSAEFSPNNKYLYANNISTSCGTYNRHYYIFQYNLQDEFPNLTKDTILNYQEDNPTYKRQGGTLRLAPDNKIYYSRPIENCDEYWWPYPDSVYSPLITNLSVINSPDSAYPACNFTPNSFYLGGARTYYGLPNNPNFVLGAIEGSECDTLSTSLGEVISYKNNQLNIFPNPCYNTCQIQYKPATQKGSIVITNIEGKIIYKENEIPLSLLKYGYEINTSAFAKGVYFVKLIMKNEIITKKLIRL